MVKQESGHPFGSAEHKKFMREQVIGNRNGNAYAVMMLLLAGVPVPILALLINNYSIHFLFLAPLYFLFCNGFEYLLHRYPMHHKMKGLEPIYEHVTVHHNFYTDEQYYFEDPKDYYIVFFPIHIVAVIVTSIAIVSLGIYATFNLDNALFFALIGYSYYFLYELLHFLSHTREDHFTKRIKWLAKLSTTHRLHHRTNLMAHYNFNITFPVFDKLLGTFYKEDQPKNSH